MRWLLDYHMFQGKGEASEMARKNAQNAQGKVRRRKKSVHARRKT